MKGGTTGKSNKVSVDGVRNRDKNLKSCRGQFDLLKVHEQKEVNSNDHRFEGYFCTETNAIIQITEQK